MKPKSPEHLAHENFMRDIVGGLRKQRLHRALHPPKTPAAEPVEDNTVHGDEHLQEMFDEAYSKKHEEE